MTPRSPHRWLQRGAAWWLDFRLPASKLVVFRVAFFSVVGLDAWLQVAHAPRYGAGDFNVSHLPALEAFLPALQRPTVLVLYLLQGYLALRIALGGTTRLALGLLTALYGVTYFGSQLDSYQHHYLVFLVLLLACFVPWRGEGEERGSEVRSSWAARLVIVQVSIVYLWTAIAKIDPLWLNGLTLSAQVETGWVRGLVEAASGSPVSSGGHGGWRAIAWLVLYTEIFLAVALLVRALWPMALVVGIVFHAGVELSGFRIGLFSYFMFAIFLLVVPDGIYRWVEGRSGPAARRLSDSLQSARKAVTDAPVAVALGVGGPLVLLALPFPEARWVAAFAAALGAAEISRRRPLAWPHAGACCALVVLALTVDAPARDYYRYWGGSARRLGDLETATGAYETVVRRWPRYAPGHTSLGNLYRRQGRFREAVVEYERAQELDPEDYRPLLGEALARKELGDVAGVVTKALEVLEREPGERRALSLLRETQMRDVSAEEDTLRER